MHTDTTAVDDHIKRIAIKNVRYSVVVTACTPMLKT